MALLFDPLLPEPSATLAHLHDYSAFHAEQQDDMTASPPPTTVTEFAESHTSAQKGPRGFIAALSAANLGVFLATTTPLVVTLAFKIDHISDSPEDATANLALVISVGAVVGLIVSPLAGRLSDRTTSAWGMRRPWILGGAVVTLAGLWVVGIATSVWVVLLAWCVVQGASNAALAAASATLPEHVPRHHRGLASGMIGAATPVGVLVGVTIVNFLDDDALRFIVPALIGSVLTVWFVFTLKDHVLPEKPSTGLSLRQIFGSFVFNPAKHPDFAWTWAAHFVVMFGYGSIASYLPYYLRDRFGFDEQAALATILLANALTFATMIISSLVGGFLSDRFYKRRLFVALAGIIIAIGLALLATAPNITTVLISHAIIGVGAGSFFSVALALATDVLPDTDETAKDLGLLNAAASLPQSIAPATAPVIIAFGAATPLGGYTFYYLVGAVLALAAAAMIYRVKRTT